MKILLSAILAASASMCAAQSPVTSPVPAPSAPGAAMATPRIAPGSKLFIEPMDGFETSLSAAMLKKKVPVVIVDDRAKAEYVLTGSSKVTEPGWAKMIFVSPNAHAEASVMVKRVHDGTLMFAYNVDKGASRRGSQSIAEACAKHLKEAIEKK